MNEESVLQYENFIYFVIKKLHTFFFIEKSVKKEEDDTEEVRKVTEDNIKNIEFVKVNENEEILDFNKKNYHIIETIFTHKIIDILIFLILRHFNTLLEQNKVNIEDENNREYEEKKKENKNNKFNFKKKDIEVKCGKLLRFLVDFLYKCVYSMTSKENVRINH